MVRDIEKRSRPRARHLRRTMTAAELRLWAHLRSEGLGAKFRRQHPVGPFIADFACIQHKLLVEIDGATHWNADGARWDAQRTVYLEAEGWRIMRFTNDDVRSNLDGVLIMIRAALT